MKKIKHLKASLVFIFGMLLLLVSCFPTDEEGGYNPELVTYPDFSLGTISPTEAYSGQIVTINGNNFGEYKESS